MSSIFAGMTGAERDQVIAQLEREGKRYRRGESSADQQAANKRGAEILKAVRRGRRG